jgi:hypothetical protein
MHTNDRQGIICGKMDSAYNTRILALSAPDAFLFGKKNASALSFG